MSQYNNMERCIITHLTHIYFHKIINRFQLLILTDNFKCSPIEASVMSLHFTHGKDDRIIGSRLTGSVSTSIGVNGGRHGPGRMDGPCPRSRLIPQSVLAT